MYKRYFMFLLILLSVFLYSACAARGSDSEPARQALTGFFEALSQGRYSDAADLYGGSYEVLEGYNPEVNPDDHAALWQNGCQVNGLQCLAVRSAHFNEKTAGGEYIFTVEFSTSDNRLFERGACCGEDAATPPQSQFEYRVVQSGDGQFLVLDLPVYVP